MTNRDSNLLAIKEGLYLIAKQLSSAPKSRPSNDIKTLASTIYNSVQTGNNPVERFYFIYLLSHVCIERPNKLEKILKTVLPSQPTPQLMEFLSDMINFAICHPPQYASLLDYLSDYVMDSESIDVHMNSWEQAQTLALDSSKFCSNLISRPDLAHLGISKQLLARWLQDLSKTTKSVTKVNLTHLIKYSLLDTEISQTETSIDRNSDILTLDSDLHSSILTTIQNNRCQDLTIKFLIDIANSLSGRLKQDDNKDQNQEAIDQIIDGFAQILSVATATKVASLTRALKTALSKLETNQTIMALIK